MFGLTRTRKVPAAPAPGSTLRVHIEGAVVADADTANIARQRSIFYETGVQLQGHSGLAYGYDRGDPANSFTTVLQSYYSPTMALAQIGRPANQSPMPVSEITDIAMSDPSLDPYQAILWNRITR